MKNITHTPEFYEKRKLYLERKTKTCIKCGIEKDKSNFTADNGHRDGLYPICNDCKAALHRKLYKKQPERFYVSVKRWASRNPDKASAHGKLNYAVRLRKIERPKHCQICGVESKLDGHHWHGYDEEHIYDVQWLCKTCHRKAER